MKDKFLNNANALRLFSPGDRVLVALSGGADSVALFDLLWSLREDLEISLEAAHVNHGLRPAADADEAFVRNLCADRGVRLHVTKVDAAGEAEKRKQSIETCARDLRYAYFDTIPCDKLATAHTCSDLTETFFMHLGRGAGLKGLCSIPPIRGKIVRPLLPFTREEIEAYCRQRELAYVTDETNFESCCLRNRVRLEVIPEIKTVFPGIEKSVGKTVTLLREDEECLLSMAEEAFSQAFVPSEGSLLIEKLFSLHPAIRRRVFVQFFAFHGCSSPEEKHIVFCDREFSSPGFSVSLPGGVTIVSDGIQLFRYTDNYGSETAPAAQALNKHALVPVDFGAYRITFSLCRAGSLPEVNVYNSCIDFGKINDIIFIRSLFPGDRVTIVRRGCSKTLKKLFTELGIDAQRRKGIPVLADGGEVIWTPFSGVNKPYLPDGETQEILIIHLEERYDESGY